MAPNTHYATGRKLACDAEYFPGSMGRGHRGLPKSSRATVPKFLRPEEVGRLREVIPETPRGRRDRALIELGLSSLRVSQVVGIQRVDLFLGRGEGRIT